MTVNPVATAFVETDTLIPKRLPEDRQHARIFQFKPRRMYFGPVRATSIDLCMRDLVRASRFAVTTRVIAGAVEQPFEDCAISYFPKNIGSTTGSRANFVARLVNEQRLRVVVVVKAHLPTASAIARRCPDTKVGLHTHNFQKSNYNRLSLTGQIHRIFKRERYRRLAGIIHVSEACARDFVAAWPDVNVPQTVIYNAFDFSEWRPAEERTQEILCVGRCIDTKGMIEAAQAVARTLPRIPGGAPGSSLRLYMSNLTILRRCRPLVPLGDQAVIEVQQPFPVVKAAYERAAIALVPSRWTEPFGHTALGAHAGGAALISSGTGGLREASGEHALYLPEAIDTTLGSPEFAHEACRGRRCLGAARL